MEAHSVSPVDAVAHIIRCQPAPLAIASVDSALYERRITPLDVERIFEALPARFQPLRCRVDGRAMSGLETIVRLMVIDAGLECEIQVRFEGIGWVDLLVDDCVVVETDGRKGHDDPVGEARD